MALGYSYSGLPVVIDCWMTKALIIRGVEWSEIDGLNCMDPISSIMTLSSVKAAEEALTMIDHT